MWPTGILHDKAMSPSPALALVGIPPFPRTQLDDLIISLLERNRRQLAKADIGPKRINKLKQTPMGNLRRQLPRGNATPAEGVPWLALAGQASAGRSPPPRRLQRQPPHV